MPANSHRNQVFIFTGPTISPELARQHLDAIYLPPVKLGDIYRITELFSPRFIGIIDGYFNQVPAVWHKEILHTMKCGIQVFGAASMGALRAAELDTLGMTGCGKIYSAYQSGLLPPFNDEVFEDDDEVAVVHSPAELGYLAASDAMVNIRFTLAKALQQEVIDRTTCLQLAGIAKKLFYADRNYPSILDGAQKQGIAGAQLSTLREWLEEHAVDQKRLDAITLLQQIDAATNNSSGLSALTQTSFAHTSQWQCAIDEIDHSHHIENSALNELRLKGPAYFEALDRASHATLNRQALNLIDNDLTQFHTSPDKLQQLYSHHWQQRFGAPTGEPLTPMQSDQILLDYLQQSGTLGPLQARASDKQASLMQMAQKPDSHDLGELDRLQLCDWYFSTCLDKDIPDQLPEYIRQLGLTDEDSFYDIILGEYAYLNRLDQQAG